MPKRLEKVLSKNAMIVEFKELNTEFDFTFAKAVANQVILVAPDVSTHDLADFIELCQNAMIMSFNKYGYVADGYGKGKSHSGFASIKPRLDLYDNGGKVKEKYHRPGNREWLTDVYNFAMITNMCPSFDIKLGKIQNISPNQSRVDQINQRLKAERISYYDLVAIGALAALEFCVPLKEGAYCDGATESPGRKNVVLNKMVEGRNKSYQDHKPGYKANKFYRREGD
jgi:hypothetical protein